MYQINFLKITGFEKKNCLTALPFLSFTVLNKIHALLNISISEENVCVREIMAVERL
jgi:hypothetical protein